MNDPGWGGGGAEIEPSGGASGRASSSLLERGWWHSDARFVMGLAPTTSQQQDQLVLLTIGQQRLLRRNLGQRRGPPLVFGFKNWT
jgi:hypothetical protein